MSPVSGSYSIESEVNSGNFLVFTAPGGDPDQFEVLSVDSPILFRLPVYYDAGESRAIRFEYYLLVGRGKGVIGAGSGVTLTSDNFLKLITSDDLLLTPATGLTPPVIYTLASDDITNPEVVTNADLGSYVVDSSTADTYFVFQEFGITGTSTTPSYKVYRFTGADGTYGAGGADTAVSGDFVLVDSSVLGSTSGPTKRPKIRKIKVGSVIAPTGDDVAQALARTFRTITHVEDEVLILEFERQIEVNADKYLIQTEGYYWAGRLGVINTGDATVDDFILDYVIQATQPITPTISGTPNVIPLGADDIDAPQVPVNGSGDLYNIDGSADFVFLIYQNTSIYTTNNYKVYRFTGANGTYGNGGANTAVLGDFTEITQVSPDEVVITSTSQLANDGEGVANRPFITDLPLVDSSGDPSTDHTANAGRTGKLGLGHLSPTEIVHIIATEAASQGGFKFQYSHDDNTIIRAQFGGENLGSELGIPSGNLKGLFLDYLGDPQYPNLRGLMMNGDFLTAGAQKNFGITHGIFSVVSPADAYAATFNQPLRSDIALPDRENEFLWKAKVINTNGEQAHLHLKTKGRESEAAVIPGYGDDPLVEIDATDSSAKQHRVYISPHQMEIERILKASGYGTGTYIEGAAVGDPDANTLGAPTYSLNVDADGYVVEVPMLFDTFVPAAYLGTRITLLQGINGFRFGRTADERLGYDVYNTSQGQYATSAFVASESPTLYADVVSLQWWNQNYISTPLASKGGLYTDTDMVFVGVNGARFEFFSEAGALTGAMNATPVLNMDPSDWTWRAQRATKAAIDAAPESVLPTKEWVNIRRVKVTLTAAQIKAGFSSPITLVAAPGAGKALRVVTASARMKYGSVAFDNNQMGIGASSGAATNAWQVLWVKFLSKTSNSLNPSGIDNDDLSMVENEALVWSAGADSVATGDSSIDIYLTYEIVEL
jgi:hypothetical protein